MPAVWVVRDGSKEISTGCGPERAVEAERFLTDYLAAKWAPADSVGAPGHPGDPAGVYVAEVIALYSIGKAPKLADPVSAKARLDALLAWWGEKTLADVRRSTCEAYVAHRMTQPIRSFTKNTPRMVTEQGARRELEDLSAAIGYWDAEHPLTRRPKVSLPTKPESPREALTRHQAARLLKAALGSRWEPEQGTWKRLQLSSRLNRAHMRRFLLMGIYTGTRPGVLPKLLWEEAAMQAWVDLDQGIIYRRGKGEKDHKTKRRPMVRLPRRLLSHMRRWRAQDLAVAAKAREAADAAGDPSLARPLITVLHHGGRPLAGRIRRGFAALVSDAGLDGEITPHWMRHTCATWLMEAGVSSWDASAYTGMSPTMLEKNYGHHRPDHQSAARKAMG